MVAVLGTTAASASLVPTLSSRTAASDGTVFSYSTILTADQGLSTGAINTSTGTDLGTRFVIFDFAGYVAGSIFSNNADFATSVEFTSSGLSTPVGSVDNPGLVNLVFTYTGLDTRTTGGPYTDISLGSFGATSIFSNTATSFFAAVGVKNSGTPYPAGTANTASFNSSSILVPQASAVPETATWAMMLLGFGGMGGALRGARRRPALVRFG